MRFTLPLLAACLLMTGCEKDAIIDSSPPQDTDPGVHPNVPEGYEIYWDTDGCGDDGDQTQAYLLGDGKMDEAGETFTATEKWYWFFGGDRSEDCIDTWEFSGTRLTQAQLESLDSSQAEAGYVGSYKKVENNCPGLNYLATWSHPGEDDFEYGDELEVTMVLIFDYLTPNGALNWENKMLVYAFIGEGGSLTWGSTSYDQAGVFTPTGDDAVGPPADLHWEPSFCFGSGE